MPRRLCIHTNSQLELHWPPKNINISIIIDNCDILQMQQILNQQRVEWTLAQHAIRPEIYCVTQLKQG